MPRKECRACILTLRPPQNLLSISWPGDDREAAILEQGIGTSCWKGGVMWESSLVG